MARFTVLYDACVLYPAPLRDLLVQLATAQLFQARWTDQIHDEWTRNLAANRPEFAGRLSRTRELMNQAVTDCLIDDYQELIPALTLPDPDDRHVLAAAIKANASVIVTTNLKDFPVDYLAQYNIEPQHPDDFISCQFDLNPPAACNAIKRLRLRLKNPSKTVAQYTEIIERQGLTRVAGRMRQFDNLL